MSRTTASTLGGTDDELSTLSTGHEVELPLSTDADIVGATFAADREAVQSLLPPRLSPIRATADRAAVTFLCVAYERIGRDAMEPYDEFGVLLPATHNDPVDARLPYASLVNHGVGGYVWYLPVTTEPARALGVDIWGYPKEVADITHEDHDGTRRTRVVRDGQHVVTIEVERPPTVELSDTSASFTEKDGQVLREALELNGEQGLWPYSDAVSVEFGDHPRADTLRGLELGDRALLRFAADAEFVIHEGVPI
jgi:hypothetical protein